MKSSRSPLSLLLAASLTLGLAGCKTPAAIPAAGEPCAVTPPAAPATPICDPASGEPCAVPGAPAPAADPFAGIGKKGKRLWAESFLWQPPPKLEVEKWLFGRQPDFEGKDKGKYIMVAIWDTWCPWCRKFIADMVKIHEAYKDEMVVIALSDEPEETVAAPFWGNHRNTAAGVPPNIPAVKFNYYVAVDTQARMKKAMGVTGVPHVFIIEPEDGCVVWEGYPYDIGYELTLEKIDKILAVGREAKKAK